MTPRDVVRAGYDAAARAYLERRAKDSADVRLLPELVARLPRGAAVLDAGCGAGVPVAEHLSQHFAVTGVDISPVQVGLARELVPAGEFVCGDLSQLDFSEATFDGVVSYHAIFHLPREEHGQALRELYRVLKPGGWALLSLGAEDVPARTHDRFRGTDGAAPTALRCSGATTTRRRTGAWLRSAASGSSGLSLCPPIAAAMSICSYWRRRPPALISARSSRER